MPTSDYLDRIVARINASNLSVEDKRRLLSLCMKIRRLVDTVRNIVSQLIALLHRHRELVRCTVLAVMLATIVRMIPFLGQPLAFAIVLIGVALGLLKEFKQEIDSLLGFSIPVRA